MADDQGSGERPNWTTGWQRLSQTFLRPASPRPARPRPEPEDLSRLSDAERQRRINEIDPTERKIGLAASILAAVLAMVATVPYMVSKTVVATTVKPVHDACSGGLRYTAKTKTCDGIYPPSHYVFYLVVLLVFALAIFVTVRIGRRAPVAFAITLTGLAIASVLASLIIVLPFLIAGGWLLLRAWRTQKFGSPTAKSPVAGYVPPARGTRAARAGSAGTTARNSTRRRRRDQADATPAVRKPPPPNKRYTPKAPPKKKPST